MRVLALTWLVLIFVSVRTLSAQASDRGDQGVLTTPHHVPPAYQPTVFNREGGRLIQPGIGVGPLRIGDTTDRVSQMFAPLDASLYPEVCGEVTSRPIYFDEWRDGSSLSVRISRGTVFQIEPGSGFHTAEGIHQEDAPAEIRRYYKNLRAYTLDATPILAVHPHIFWVGAEQGIAFEFAYNPRTRNYFLNKIAVFRPNGEYCPEGRKPELPYWQEITPYSLGPTQTRGKEADLLIREGAGVGPIRLGEPSDPVRALLPPLHGGVETSCGEVLSRNVMSDGGGLGTLSVFIRDDKIVQVDSGTPRFHTADRIAAHDSPLKVRQHYKGLRAYAYSKTDMALGDRPVIFWVDAKRGIAFEFAYSRSEDRRYLYSIIIFPPNGEFCPEQEKLDPSEWTEIAPYTLESQEAF